MPGEIYYWDGLIIDESVAKKYMEVIMQLKNRELQEAGLDLKQMRSHQIFSVRTSRKGRILFTISEIDKKRCLIFLEDLSNHEYKKSRFLNHPKTLSHFLDKNQGEFRKIVNLEDEFIDVDASVLPLDDIGDEQLVYTPVEYYNQEFIKLNDSQKEAKYAKGPAIIEGPPGSGKSCAALSLVANAPTELNKVLYVTSSAALVSHMEGLYQSLPAELESPPGRVVFKSYAQLVHESDPATVSKRSVGLEHFSEWFGSYCTRKQQQLKTAKTDQVRGKGKGKRVFSKVPLLPKELLDAATVYQEFRTVAAYVDYVDTRYGTSKAYTQSSYEGLGEKHQSLFKKEHRSWLYQAYQDYAAYLRHHECIDLSFYHLQSTEVYDMVVADEAQDFSKAQIQQLIALTPSLQIYFCRDSHQSLTDSQSSGPFIKEHLYQLGHKTGIEVQHIQLPSSYRVFPNAQPLVDKLLDLRLKLIGGRADNLEYVQLPLTVEENSTLGSVHWFEQVPEDAHRALQDATQSSDLVIITLPEWIEEAKAFFNTDVVYTVDQVKGLQFPVVVLYRMAEDEALIEANKLLAHPERSYVASSSTAHRPAAGVGNPKFGPPLNRFFTAVTRAQQQIIVIQPSQHQYSYIIDAIRSTERFGDDFKIELTKQSYSEDNWLQLVQKLIHKKELSLAQTIYVKHLKKTTAEFKEFLQITTAPPSVVATSSVTISPVSTVIAPQQATYSSSSSTDAASVSAAGIFSAKTSSENTSRYHKRRGGRRAQQASSSNASSTMLSTKSALATAKTAALKSRTSGVADTSKARLSASGDDSLVGMQFLAKPPMEELLSNVLANPNPGLYLSTLLSCGAIDSHKLRELFFYYPQSKEVIDVCQLCLTVSEKEPHTSLLSQLCSPYNESRHVALFFLFENEHELFNSFASGYKCFLLSYQESHIGESPEATNKYLAFFQKKSQELRELQFLQTTETGKQILLKLARKMEWTAETLATKMHHAFRMNLEANFPVPLQNQQKLLKILDHDVLAFDLNRENEESWGTIVTRYPTDDISRAVVRLMVQANIVGEDIWCNMNCVSLSTFFQNLFYVPALQKILSDKDKEIAKRVIMVMNAAPQWTAIEQKTYICGELNGSDLDRTSTFSGILRTVRKHLAREHSLINQLYKSNKIFWGNTVKKLSNLFPNQQRVDAILNRLSANDSVAEEAFKSVKILDFSSIEHRAFILWNFFVTCKNLQDKEELGHSSLLENIISWLRENQCKSLKEYFAYITTCLNSDNLRPLSLLAAYLRLAQDILAKESLRELEMQRKAQVPQALIAPQIPGSENSFFSTQEVSEKSVVEEPSASCSMSS
ncbi:hypothetical protein ELY21_11205 [Legionella sp. km535]|uniref:hypothetical protein n=1 Tax=Legionella sp. km535 TaxID=2498107 RepID=UPI000F8DECDE|nr:hypothetical protein [Legionella sp. km535]RUR17280.1 hypothetical protein ELY21_11205 [Legionella sp. km535]